MCSNCFRPASSHLRTRPARLIWKQIFLLSFFPSCSPFLLLLPFVSPLDLCERAAAPVPAPLHLWWPPVAAPRALAASPLAARTPVAERFSPSSRSARASGRAGGHALRPRREPAGRARCRARARRWPRPRREPASRAHADGRASERAAAPVPAAVHAHAGGRHRRPPRLTPHRPAAALPTVTPYAPPSHPPAAPAPIASRRPKSCRVCSWPSPSNAAPLNCQI